MIRDILGELWNQIDQESQKKLEQLEARLRKQELQADQKPMDIDLGPMVSFPVHTERLMLAVGHDGAVVLEHDGAVLDAVIEALDPESIEEQMGVMFDTAGIMVWEGRPQWTEDDLGIAISFDNGAWRNPKMEEWEALMRGEDVWPMAEDEGEPIT